MTAGRFMLRRLIRLHPMVILSVILGAIAFYHPGSVQWDGTPVSLHHVIIALVLGLFLIPAFPGVGYEVRGNGEMFPLNGPSWSLFLNTSEAFSTPYGSTVCRPNGCARL